MISDLLAMRFIKVVGELHLHPLFVLNQCQYVVTGRAGGYYVGGGPPARPVTTYLHLHVRTCATLFHVSGTNPLAMRFTLS